MAAYLITFRCYGTWLHVDERRSVHRRQNDYGAPLLEPHRGWQRAERQQMKHEPVLLDAAMREVVEKTVREVAAHRIWEIFALAVRTNHVHAVVGGDDEPEKVMTDFKAWSTRRLREAELIPCGVKLWAQHGSTRYLWDDAAITAACAYAGDGQGEEIPV